MRIIIVGAGPAGLILAHCLLKAGVDNIVLLERRESALERSGAGLVMWSHNMRIMDQLGLLDDLVKMQPRSLERSINFWPDGRVMNEGGTFNVLAEK
jgi:2-polyprenyl-6-methoxyphenol hydroxylase-like FAD-dependent oxidoreductase